jgi:6-phosphogluconolactonase
MSGRRFGHADPGQAAESCARHIRARLEEAMRGDSMATLAISGGSSPRILFERLTASPFPWERVELFWVDERCVPPGDPQSNFTMAESALIAPAGMPRRNVHRIRGELRPEEAAARYIEEIRATFGIGPNGLPRFDVIHLGMGADGHTASLFPGEPLLKDRENIAAAVYVEKFSQWRVTLLPGALLAARHAVFFVGGPDKAPALRAVVEGEYEPSRYPAQIVARGGRAVTWFLDRAAAGMVAP